MTPGQRKVLRALVAERKAHERAAARVKAARAELRDKCTHPVEALVKFQWEHDNGYGRQEWCTGLRCRICHAECHYPNLDGSPNPPIRWHVPEWART